MEISDFKTEKIEDIRIPWIICGICKQKRSGILHVMGSNNKLGRRLFFSNGLLQFANSNLDHDRLGEMLVSAKRITNEQLEKALQKKVPGKRIGKVLIESGAINQKEINYFVGMQIRNILFSTFELSDGLYFFEEKRIKLPKDLQLKVLVGHLIHNGIRSMKNLILVNDEVSRIGDKPLAQGNDPLYKIDKLPLTQNEAFLYSRIDGRMSLHNLLKITDLPREIVYRFIYAGLCLEFIAVVEGAKTISMNRFDRAFKQESPEGLSPLAVDELTREEKEQRKLIQRKQAQISLSDYWQFLEVKESASDKKIKENYDRLCQEFHPGLFQKSYLADLSPYLNQIISYLNISYNTLSNPAALEQYIKMKDQEKEEERVSLNEKQEIAEKLYNKGEYYYLNDDFFNAHRHFELALRYFPKKARFWCAKGKTELENPKWLKRAKESLTKAIKMDAFFADPHLYLAKIHLLEGENEKAKSEIAKLLEISPVHEAGLEMEEELKGSATKGFLSKFNLKK